MRIVESCKKQWGNTSVFPTYHYFGNFFQLISLLLFVLKHFKHCENNNVNLDLSHCDHQIGIVSNVTVYIQVLVGLMTER